jgi:dihydrolipoamide dehydrogenase
MYDVIVIGGGPGGYLAAERAGARGKKVLLVEKDSLGGVCLNVGCIPTKTLLNAAKNYVHGIEAAQFGVHFDNPRFVLSEAMEWKARVVKTLVKGVEYQMKAHHVEVVKGEARMVKPRTVSVAGTEYEGQSIIIATGSSTFIPPIPGVESKHVLTSTEVLSLKEMPKKLIVIGGGVIGIEFASFFSSLGVDVHVIEMLPEIIPLMDPEFSKEMRRALKGITFHLSSKVESIKDDAVTFTCDGKTETLSGDVILMSVGRRPNVRGLGFEEVGLDVTPKGVNVNERMETNLPGVYAVGDVTGKSLLAHSAYRMAEVAVNNICGRKDRMRYHAIPWVVYSMPEASGCGLTESDAKKAGRKIKTATLQMRANGRFIAENANAPGFCKVIADADTDVLLGVHLIGALNSEMIYGIAAMLEAELRVKEIKEIVFPHPTVSEIIKDALWELK